MRNAQRWTIGPEAAFVDDGQRVAALDPRTGDPIVLIGSAAVTWRQLLEHRDERVIVRATAQTFGVEEESIIDDVKNFLDRLHARDLIEQEEPTSRG